MAEGSKSRIDVSDQDESGFQPLRYLMLGGKEDRTAAEREQPAVIYEGMRRKGLSSHLPGEKTKPD